MMCNPQDEGGLTRVATCGSGKGARYLASPKGHQLSVDFVMLGKVVPVRLCTTINIYYMYLFWSK